MKKILILLLFTLLCSNIAFASPVIYEKPDVKIIVEGTELQLDDEVPIIVNSRTLVPLRRLLVGLGVPDNTENIQWIGEKREVKVIYNGVNIELAIDSSKAYINGQEYTLDSAPIIYKDRTYLPARFVGEALNYTISWDSYTPAVLVTSNENMDKLTQILNDLNTAMNNVNSYEVASVRNTSIASTYDGETENDKYTVTSIERADLEKKIIYTESSYSDDSGQSFNFSYNTLEDFYNCYKYLEDDILYNTGWEKYEYDSQSNRETPFDEKGKTGLIRIDTSLYGTLLCKEYNNAYLIFAPSYNLDILKSIDGMELYNEINGAGRVEDFTFQLAVSKDTSLPIRLEVKFKLIAEEITEDYSFNSIENTDYIIDYSEYNQQLEFELPTV